MKRLPITSLLAATVTVCATHGVAAQIARARTPLGEPPPIASAAPRDARFPYAGLWRGTRTMPVGDDEIVFRFTVTNGIYSGATMHPGGGRELHRGLTAAASGLSWEQPNSGGGTWVYHVRLVGPDSMQGTLVLRDAPAQFTEVPKGTVVLTRQSGAGRGG